MKKIILMAAAMMLCAGVASAQQPVKKAETQQAKVESATAAKSVKADPQAKKACDKKCDKKQGECCKKQQAANGKECQKQCDKKQQAQCADKKECKKDCKKQQPQAAPVKKSVDTPKRTTK